MKQQKKQSSSVSGSGVRSATASPQPVFGIRKARSDPDINVHNMQKEVDVSGHAVQWGGALIMDTNGLQGTLFLSHFDTLLC